MSEYFGLLYARASFLEGVARVVDLGGTLNEYNYSPTPQQADANALRADLNALREDFKRAQAQLRREDEDGA